MNKQAYNILTDPYFSTFGDTPTTRNIYTGIVAGGSGLLLGALARAIERYRVSEKPYYGVDIRSNLDNTLPRPLMTKKDVESLTTEKEDKPDKKKKQEKKAAIDWGTMLRLAVPATALAGGFALGSRYMDRQYEQQDKEELTEQKAILENLHRQIINARVLNARGQLSDSAYESLIAKATPILAKNASLKKDAGVIDTLQSAGGLLMATAFALSAYGSYKYFSKRNPKNMKYEAIKKGLKEYATNSSNLSPIGQDLINDPELAPVINQGKTTPVVSETPTDSMQVTI